MCSIDGSVHDLVVKKMDDDEVHFALGDGWDYQDCEAKLRDAMESGQLRRCTHMSVVPQGQSFFTSKYSALDFSLLLCQRLRVLDLSQNPWVARVFPREMPPSLVELVLRNCGLTELPNELLSYPRLETRALAKQPPGSSVLVIKAAVAQIVGSGAQLLQILSSCDSEAFQAGGP